MLKIICAHPGLRRAGVAHPAVKTWPAEAFSNEQLAVLKADPAFTLEFVTSAEPEAAAVVAGCDRATIAAVVRLLTRGDTVEAFVGDMVDALAGAIQRGDTVDTFWPTAVEVAQKHEITGEGRSGTARKASSAGSGPDVAGAAAASGGVQPAAPQQPEPADLLTLHGSGASVGSTNTEGAPTPPPADAGPSTDSSMQAGTGDALDNAASLATEIVGSQGVPSASEESVEESGEASEAAAAVASEPTPAPTKKSRATKSTS